MRVLGSIAVMLLAPACALAGWEQQESQFVLDDSKPYVYLEFDHLGPRKPIREVEPSTGLWLRIVNNCRVRIRIGTFNSPTDDAGIGVLDEIIPYREGVRVEAVQAKVPTDPPQLEAEHYSRPTAPKAKPPEGYWAEVHSTETIAPGESLLFSVPINHVGESWFMRVYFTLAVSRPQVGDGPYSYLDFYETQIPANCRGLKQCGPVSRPLLP